jgi:hypothetical protein
MATSTELKAQAYDILAQLEQLQRALAETNQAIIAAVQSENTPGIEKPAE